MDSNAEGYCSASKSLGPTGIDFGFRQSMKQLEAKERARKT